MRDVRLGATDLRVSAICFGTWAFGGDWGQVDRDEADATIGRALDVGINFFDTAPAYGFGAADVKLTDDDRAEIDRIMAAAAPVHGPTPEGM